MSVEIRGIQVVYQRWGEEICPFDSLSLSIEDGEWVMLAGPNGSGKTTLLRAVAGVQPLRRGEIVLWNDRRTGAQNYEDPSTVFLVQQNPLNGTAADLTVFENLYLAESCPRDRTTAKERCLALLKPLGLANHLNHPVTSLSGGQRQLLAIAIADLRPARLILLDEPLASLDPVRSVMALEGIRDLHRRGKSILQVTHSPELMTTEGTRTIVLDRGELVYDERGNQRDSKKMREAIVSALTHFN
jgi:ABC-type uncharacterized transport system ATPase component